MPLSPSTGPRLGLPCFVGYPAASAALWGDPGEGMPSEEAWAHLSQRGLSRSMSRPLRNLLINMSQMTVPENRSPGDNFLSPQSFCVCWGGVQSP